MRTNAYQDIPALIVTAMGLLITTVAGAERPNIILAMSDDMGWRDLS